MGMIEPNFGINWQALSVLANLQSRDGLECSWKDGRYRAMVMSAPWYNGRERGVVFYLQHLASARQVNIAVFEHRVGDHICATEWEGELTLNPPTLEDVPTGRRNSLFDERWPNGYVADAANWIYDRLERFWSSCESASEKVAG